MHKLNFTIKDIINIFENIAPSRLSEDWDNSGLQIGDINSNIEKIIIALDADFNSINFACAEKANLLITHHPLIFKPLKNINLSDPFGAIIKKIINSNLAVFSAHTNLDIASGGVNDVLAEKIGLKNLKIFKNPKNKNIADLSNNLDFEFYKFIVYAPLEFEQEILNALFEANENFLIGNYTCCSFRNAGTGTFKPLEGSNPFIGDLNQISHVNEVKIEAVINKKDILKVIKLVKSKHPYETVAYDIYPLLNFQALEKNINNNNLNNLDNWGLGRIGELDKKLKLIDFVYYLKEKLKLNYLKFSGDPNLIIEKVAICSGSGSSLMADFFNSNAQAYISGDLHYHNAKDACSLGKAIIDIGHFASEVLIIDTLVNKLKSEFLKKNINIEVKSYQLERDPFNFLGA